MSCFNFNPMEVGNPMTIGMIEENLISELKILENKSIFNPIDANEIQNLLDRYNLSYFELPNYIKIQIDKINCV